MECPCACEGFIDDRCVGHSMCGQPNGECDGCGARVPLDQLSLVVFIELEGFACGECTRETVVILRGEQSR